MQKYVNIQNELFSVNKKLYKNEK